MLLWVLKEKQGFDEAQQKGKENLYNAKGEGWNGKKIGKEIKWDCNCHVSL